MNTNLQKQSSISDGVRSAETVTRDEALKIAHELALINGHLAHDTPAAVVSPDGRILTERPSIDLETELLETAPESERWDPVPGSTGHKAPTATDVEEDDGGRSVNERLVAAGVAEAGNDQMRQARSKTVRNT